MASSTTPDVEMRPPSSQPSDPALSLRELALKSIKSRRRPPADTLVPSLPFRPPPPSEASFQLDYGQEDDSTPRDIPQPPSASIAKSSVQTHKPSTPTTSRPPVASAPALDTQGREEGEISDEEDVQSPPPVQPKSPLPLPPPASSISAVPKHPILSPAQPDGMKNKLTLHERLSNPLAPSDSVASISSDTSSDMQVDAAPALSKSRYLDSAYIRPGVAMTQDQYDKAKDIVLDLLGWGVDPTYLVDCGVTREVVYYVFTELNLRLPHNLDTTGLVPFTPEDALELKESTIMPPPPPPPPNQVKQPSQSLPTMPARTPLREPSPSSAVQMTISTPALESPRPVSTSELHDMEQQRRQELMARKAAIASKKSKQVITSTQPSSPRPAPGPPSTSANQDDGMNVDTVEDFLKSIGSSSTPNNPAASATAPFQPTTDDMDADEIPGLQRSSSYKVSSTNGPPPPPSASSTLSETVISPISSSHAPLSPASAPPSSTESGSTTFSTRSFDTTTSTLSEGPALQRRGMKRPVASDFVDFDNDSRSSSTNGYRYANGNMKRRVAGFASLTTQPRCVIDISDSEGEGDGDVHMREVERSASWRGGYASPVPTKPFATHLNTNGWATPPISLLTPATPSLSSTPNGTLSPAALAAKETEIQRMREMIAQKERKLKEAKVALEAANKADIKVKREEITVTIPSANRSTQNGRLATPTVDAPQLSARRPTPPLPSTLSG